MSETVEYGRLRQAKNKYKNKDKMKKEAIISKLRKANKFKGSALPIIEVLHFDNGYMQCTDIENELFQKVGFEGCFTVNKAQFYKTVNNAPKGAEIAIQSTFSTVQITVNNKYKYTLKNEQGVYEGHKLFPNYDTSGLTKAVTVNQSEIVKASKYCIQDELRPIMEGINFGENHIVSTDAHKLYFSKDVEFHDKNEGFTIRKICADMIDKGFNSLIELSKNRTVAKVSISEDGSFMYSRLVVGKYPNWQGVIPQSHETELKLNKSEILEALKASESTIDKYMPRIDFTANGSIEMGFKNLNNSSNFSTELDGEKTGSDMAFAVNPNLLKDILGSLESEYVSIKIQAPNRGLIINGKALLMPVMRY